MKKLIRTLILCMVPMLLMQPAHAKTYRATNWLAPFHTLNAEPYQKFAKELAADTDGAISFTVYSSGSLVPAEATLQALANGVAVLGIVYPPYNPAELPLNNVLNDLVFASTDPMAAAFAYTEINLTNQRLIKEWSKERAIFAGGYATPLYNFLCVKAIRTLADAKGKKIRTAGGTQTDWVTHIGAVPVSVPIGDVYTGLSRGSLDCTMAATPNLMNSKLWEVTSSVTRLPMGVVLGAVYVLNPNFWHGLDEKLRRTLLNHMAMGMARSQVAYANRVDEALEGAKERGLEIIEPSKDLKQDLSKFKKSFLTGLAKESMEKYSIEDPSALINEFQKLEAKWHKLLENVDRDDPKAIAELLREKIYSRVDVTAYGIESSN